MTGGRHRARLAAAARLVLPLLALAVLSTLFLFSERRGGVPGDGLPWSEDELGALARDMRLGAPRFASVTADGAALVIAAAEVRPDPDGTGAAGAREMAGRLRHRDGLAVDIAAPRGQLDTGAGLAALSGGAVVETGTGYRLETDRLTAALDRTRLESGGAVVGTGPPGRLTAGRMTVTAVPGAHPTRHVLVFKDGVRVVYDPAR